MENCENCVSIHATLAGGDPYPFAMYFRQVLVSIHATLAGGDPDMFLCFITPYMFLSTPPSRVAT